MTDNEYKPLAGKMFLIVWILIFALFFLFFYFYNQKNSSQVEIHAGQVSISADKQGHFYVDGLLVNKKVTFLLDTGSTLVAVPKPIATDLNLKGYYPVTISTANGQVQGLLTRIPSLSFAGFTLYDVKAIIMDSADNEVLLGMNVLSQFQWNQKGGILTLNKIPSLSE